MPTWRLAADVASSNVRGFGNLHGVDIEVNEAGGQLFYDYLTKPSSFSPEFANFGGFAQINIYHGPGDVSNHVGFRDFIKGLIDASQADEGGERCPIFLDLFSSLGYPDGMGDCYNAVQDMLVAIGPCKTALRRVGLRSEYSYKMIEPPETLDVLQEAWNKMKALVNSYGYPFGWADASKFLKYIPKTEWEAVNAWGPVTAVHNLSWNPDCVVGAQEAYVNARDCAWNFPYGPTVVGAYGMGMHSRAAQVPGAAPFYMCFEKMEGAFRGITEAFDRDPNKIQFGAQAIMPHTFNDREVNLCPYITDWWPQLCQKYDVRTYQSPYGAPPVPCSLTPPYPYPPYPLASKVGELAMNLPPFYAPKNGILHLYTNVKNLNTWGGYSGPIDYYIMPLRTITIDSLKDRTYFASADVSAGWAYPQLTIAPDLPPRDYTIFGIIPSSAGFMESWSDTREFIRIVDFAHVITLETTNRFRIGFGLRDEYPWDGMDPWRWLDPAGSNYPHWGYCIEDYWRFIASDVSDDGVPFSYWEVSRGPQVEYVYEPDLTIFVDSNMTLRAVYGEPIITGKGFVEIIAEKAGKPVNASFTIINVIGGITPFGIGLEVGSYVVEASYEGVPLSQSVVIEERIRKLLPFNF